MIEAAQRHGGGGPAPSPSAEIRSQAIAKLKRAASLPRTPDGRRPPAQQLKGSGPSVPQYSHDRTGSSSAEDSSTPSPTKPSSSEDYGDQELLSPSFGGPPYNHSGAASAMQRTPSDASSFHIPTPPHVAYASSSNASPFFSAQPSPVGPNADWAAYQLAQSYLPSISPVPAPPSSFPANLHATAVANGAGRNTPSPLPTLGELRNLSRSNSAAARANAMNKLVGGGGGGMALTPTRSTNVGTPLSSSEEDVTLSIPGSRPSLYRSGTIGVPRMFGIVSDTPSDSGSGSVDDTAIVSQIPDTQFDVPRPRLQRSFTVSSSNMGEERRSAVGRRMVERLAERRAARQQEEEEVRKLWEERRHTRGSAKLLVDPPSSTEATPTRPPIPVSAPPTALTGGDDGDDGISPTSARGPSAFAGGAALGVAGLLGRDLLSASDRTASRSTQRSDDVFEFQSHLSRNISTRTARTEAPEASPATRPSPLYEAIADHSNGGLISGGEHLAPQPQGQDDCTPIDIPELSMLTPTKPTRNNKEPSSSSGTSMRSVGMRGHRPTASFDSRSSYGSRDSRSTDGGGGQDGGHYWDQGYHHDDEIGSNNSHQDATNMPYNNEDETRHARNDDLDPRYSNLASDVDSGSSQRSHSRVSDEGRQQQLPPLHSVSHSRQSTVDSWVDVGASSEVAQQAGHLTPDDRKVHKKSSSVSKMREMFHSMRRPSVQKFGNGEASPRTPSHDEHGFRSGRDSGHSSSDHHHGQQQKRSDSRLDKQPPSRSLSPMGNHQEANNMLIHHQLSSSSNQASFVPRANVNDPRVLNSKLSPFPGIASLEQRGRDQESRLGFTDSGSRALSPAVSPNLGTHESNGRRGWPGNGAARTSAHSNGRSSTYSDGSNAQRSHSRSENSQRSRNPSHRVVTPSGTSDRSDAESPTAYVLPRSGSFKQRPEIPSFMMNRRRAPPPPIEVAESNVVSINDDPPVNDKGALMPRSREVLNRMDNMLTMPANDPARPDVLDDPPRKLLLAQQVLQVVNMTNVKDRYLFLFNDILVIAKPLISPGIATANLDMKFVVKSIVSLDKLAVSGISDEAPPEAPKHPVVQQFIRNFADDSTIASRSLMENTKLDSKTLASLVFSTPELDKSQLGQLLAKDAGVMRGFMAKFNFVHMRIDDALRIFLLAVRLPSDIRLAESLLRNFAKGYYASNEDIVEYDQTLACDLVLATLELNDMLYSTFGFAYPNHAISRDSFISSFRAKDPHHLVSDDLLLAIYSSIRGSKLLQALPVHETHLSRPVAFDPSPLPTHLPIDSWSNEIKITVPRPDPQFKVKILGAGLEADPPQLDFTRSSTQSFRVRGLDVGAKTLHFERSGTTAPLYAALGNSRTINVEPSFMRNTFHLSFASPSGTKRKYCFSVADASARQKWGTMLTRQIWLTTEKKTGTGAPTTKEGRVRRAAETVSLQVLRDALMPSSPEVQQAARSKHASIAAAFATESPPLNDTTSLQTGKELVLLCRQNSLLPSVLEHLQTTTEPHSAPLPRSEHVHIPAPRSGVPRRL